MGSYHLPFDFLPFPVYFLNLRWGASIYDVRTVGGRGLVELEKQTRELISCVSGTVTFGGGGQQIRNLC